MDGVIRLIAQRYERDGIGQDVPVESARDVFCEIRSASRAEWSAAGQNSINVSVVAVTNAANYNGERIAEVNGSRKAIYRTYMSPNSDDIELYMHDEVGA